MELELDAPDIAGTIASAILEILHRHLGQRRRLVSRQCAEIEVRVAPGPSLHIIRHVGEADLGQLREHALFGNGQLLNGLRRGFGVYFLAFFQKRFHSLPDCFILLQTASVAVIGLEAGDRIGFPRISSLSQLLSKSLMLGVFQDWHGIVGVSSEMRKRAVRFP